MSDETKPLAEMHGDNHFLTQMYPIEGGKRYEPGELSRYLYDAIQRIEALEAALPERGELFAGAIERLDRRMDALEIDVDHKKPTLSPEDTERYNSLLSAICTATW